MAATIAGPDASAELPSIVRVNRAHLPLAPARYLATLWAELEACEDSEHQARMLLNEPLLLHAVAVEICRRLATAPSEPAPASRSEYVDTICREATERCKTRARQRAAEGTLADAGQLGSASAGRSPSAALASSARLSAGWPALTLSCSQSAASAPSARLSQGCSPTALGCSSSPSRLRSPRRGGLRRPPSFHMREEGPGEERRPGPEPPGPASETGSSPRPPPGPAAAGHRRGSGAGAPAGGSEPRLGEALGELRTVLRRSLWYLVPVTRVPAGVVRNTLWYHKCTGIGEDMAVLPRYDVVKDLGFGHFGAVVLARERCTGQLAAVKEFDRPPRESPEGAVEDEGHILNALAHPNLIRLFEVVESEDKVHLVMEFAPGATLSAHAARTARGPWISGALQQVLSATAYCHTCRILHGDLKPENVLVGGARPDGSPFCLVSDFGHASVCMGVEQQVLAAGDPRYIPPEVVDGLRVSQKSDIFMLGMATYELLSGGWLPFFRERAEFLDTECPFYDATQAWFMVKSNMIQPRVRAGMSHQDRQWLRRSRLPVEQEHYAPPLEAQELVVRMLAFHEGDRPSAKEVLGDPWVDSGSQACKAARDAASPAEFGLWRPRAPGFAELARRRRGLSPMLRLIVAAMSRHLDADTLFPARLLFRWMDLSGSGFLYERDLRRAAEKVGLDPAAAAMVFSAGDIYGEGWLDFTTFTGSLVDPSGMEEDMLRRAMRSMINHFRGPSAEDGKDEHPSSAACTPTSARRNRSHFSASLAASPLAAIKESAFTDWNTGIESLRSTIDQFGDDETVATFLVQIFKEEGDHLL